MYYYEPSRELDRDGFALHVSQDHLRGELPRWRARRPHAPRGQHLLRFEAGDETPFLWARIDTYLEDFMLLKRADQSVSASVFAPWRQGDVEQIEREVEHLVQASLGEVDVARCRALCWGRRVAQCLSGAQHQGMALRHNVLWRGLWRLDRSLDYANRFSTWRAGAFEQYMQCFQAFAYHVGSVDLVFPWPTRVASEEDAARVKYYRKLSRQGLLPPVICLWIFPFSAPIILDGHDRMLAALLERREPEFLILEPFSSTHVSAEQLQAQQSGILTQYEAMQPYIEHVSGRSLDYFNRQVIMAFEEEHHRSMLRVWPLPGGAPRWRAEVTAQLSYLPEEERIPGELVRDGFA